MHSKAAMIKSLHTIQAWSICSCKS